MSDVKLQAVITATDRSAGAFASARSHVDQLKSASAATFASVKSGLKELASTAAIAGVAIAGIGAKVMATGMDFEKALLDAGNKFAPGIKKTDETFKKLSAAAQEWGGKTEFSSSQAATALNDLAGAGFNADQAIAALPKTIDFATAASLSLTEASEVASKALGAYGLKSDDPKVLADNLQLVTDVLMKTDALSSTNMTSIFEAYKEAGPVAKGLGVPLQSFSAMIATLGTAGIEGSVAGTTLKNTLLSLANPSKEAGASLKKFGIETADAAGNLRDPLVMLEELSVKTANLGTAEKATVLEGIFGKIPIAGVNVMLAKIDEMKTQRDELMKSGGQVELVATSKRSGGTSAWDNFTSAIEAAQLKTFDVIGPDITVGIEKATDAIGELATLAMPFIRTFTTGLQKGFGEAWPKIEGALGVFFKHSGGAERFTNVLGGFAVVVGKVAAAGVGLAAVFGAVVVGAMNVVTTAVNILTGAWDLAIGGIGRLAFAIGDGLANIGAKWRSYNFAKFGLFMVSGIAEGITNAIHLPVIAVEKMAGAAIDALRAKLKIGSPSRLTAEIGSFAAQGLSEGWADQMPAVNAEVERTIGLSSIVQPFPPTAFDQAQRPDRMIEPPRWTKYDAAQGLSEGWANQMRPAIPPAVPPMGGRSAGQGSGAGGESVIVVKLEAADGTKAEVVSAPKGTKIKIVPTGAPGL